MLYFEKRKSKERTGEKGKEKVGEREEAGKEEEEKKCLQRTFFKIFEKCAKNDKKWLVALCGAIRRC